MSFEIGGSAKSSFTGSDFRIIADLAYRESGIDLPEAKSQFVYSRLINRVRQLRLGSFREYCDLLKSEKSGGELPILISALTTDVTRFRRESHHTDHLREKILPPLLKRAARGERVRIWSAACSTGEEAYEIAFEILDQFADAADLDVKILATDIDLNALSLAQTGEYSALAVRVLPRRTIRRHFLPDSTVNDTMTVADEPRRLLSFRPLNLVRPWPVNGPFDAIFCRNVAIYFDAQKRESLWQRFAEIITTGGVLYVGHSERILGPATNCLLPDGVTTFRRQIPLSAGPPLSAALYSKGSA